MELDYEISPSSKARCNSCGKVIPKGVPRIFMAVVEFGHKNKKCYCYRCANSVFKNNLKWMRDEILLLKEAQKEFKLLVKKNLKAIMVSDL